MYKVKEVTNGIYYVGVNDRVKENFENFIPIPSGVSYNSYLIVDDKTVLVEGVEISFAEDLITSVKKLLDNRKLDYLVVNHMEPDHSGAIRVLCREFPDMKIIGNIRTIEMIEGYYGLGNQCIEVKDNESLSIGKKTLHFLLTPMLHWPETMMTYESATETLFSGDVFGAFGTLNGAVVDENMQIDRFWDGMERYYVNVMGKYGKPMQHALEKIIPYSIQHIAPTHGPVWKKYIPNVLLINKRLSAHEPLPGAVIVYDTMYSNTAQMAEIVAQGLSDAGESQILIHNTSRTDSSVILTDVFKYRTIIFGSPTYQGTLHPNIEVVLNKIAARGLANRVFSAFGSYTWASASVRILLDFASKMRWEIVGSVAVKQRITEKDYDALYELGLNSKK